MTGMYFITLTGEYTRKTLVEVDTLSMHYQ